MLSFRDVAMWIACAVGLLLPGSAAGQEMSGEYKSVLTTLGKTGDFKDGVLKVNIPRTDLRVTIGQRPAPTPFGFGGWVALTKGADGMDVLMGDLVCGCDGGRRRGDARTRGNASAQGPSASTASMWWRFITI
jgi:hypothetical protein